MQTCFFISCRIPQCYPRLLSHEQPKNAISLYHGKFLSFDIELRLGAEPFLRGKPHHRSWKGIGQPPKIIVPKHLRKPTVINVETLAIFADIPRTEWFRSIHRKKSGTKVFACRKLTTLGSLRSHGYNPGKSYMWSGVSLTTKLKAVQTGVLRCCIPARSRYQIDTISSVIGTRWAPVYDCLDETSVWSIMQSFI